MNVQIFFQRLFLRPQVEGAVATDEASLPPFLASHRLEDTVPLGSPRFTAVGRAELGVDDARAAEAAHEAAVGDGHLFPR